MIFQSGRDITGSWKNSVIYYSLDSCQNHNIHWQIRENDQVSDVAKDALNNAFMHSTSSSNLTLE